MISHENIQDAESRTTKEQEIFEALRIVQDPEIHQSIVDLGLVYGVSYDEGEQKVQVRMTLTTPMCPFGPEIIRQVTEVASSQNDVKEATIDIVWTPAWDPKTMVSDDIKMELGIW